MQLSKNKLGFTSIEAMIFFIVISLVLTIFFIRGTNSETHQLRYKTLLKNMKIVANAAEEQKRYLGYYPSKISALVEKAQYLSNNGNTGRVTNENLLKTQWNGPYIKNIKIKDEKTILNDIIKEKTGEIILRNRDLYYKVGNFSESEKGAAEKLYKDCSYVRSDAQIIKNTLVMPSYVSLCGYETNADHITSISYYIGKK